MASIKDIGRVIQEVTTISHTIVTAMEEQTATVNEITLNLSGANQAAQEIALSVGETATGVTEVSQNIQLVNNSTCDVANDILSSATQAKQLVELGQKLQNLVHTFNIKAAFIPWVEEYSVGINEIDKQHKVLVGCINENNEAMSTGQPNKGIAKILKNLQDYTETHFTYEENLMNKYSYPGLDSQKVAHTQFVNKIDVYYAELRTNKSLINKDIALFLKDWLLNHILVSDKKYSQFFHKKNVR